MSAELPPSGPTPPATGTRQDRAERALASCYGSFLVVGVFSAVVNLLMLTGPLYMLQVYDRVLPSRSIPTLIALSIAAAVLYVLQGLFDGLRQRILGRTGVALDQALNAPMVAAIIRAPLRGRSGGEGLQPSRDLDTVRGFLSSLGPTALFDLPWMPLYLGACFLLHPVLGWTLVGGASVLVGLTLLTEWRTRRPVREAARTGAARAVMLEAARRNGEVIAALGMEQRVMERFGAANAEHVATQLRAADTTMTLGTASKVIRFLLQSTMLGVGAFLVIQGEASPGVIIASSVLSSRALAPMELAISSWRPFLAARQAWQRLRGALATLTSPPQVAPERASRLLSLDHVHVAAPGSSSVILANVSLRLEAGHAVGVIGPSASGKSTLARALVGVWPVLRGDLRLDGATLDQWPAQMRGAMIGYVPQDVELFDGTVAQNIARFDPTAPEEAVRAAARAAGAYDMILRLPQGFETRIGEAGCVLSGGQRQRLALARALYGDPFLVVLDEPNASLDAEGDAALASAIRGVRARGGIVVIIAHRPAALAEVDLVLTLAQGQVQAFGPKDEVLRKTLAPRPAAPSTAPVRPAEAPAAMHRSAGPGSMGLKAGLKAEARA